MGNDEKMIAGAVQIDVQLGDIDSNLTAVLHGLRELAGHGTRLAVLPEMWSCGFDNDRLEVHAGRTDEILEILSAFADRNSMVIAVSMPEAVREGVYNTTFLIDSDGKMAGGYRKIHLFSPTGEDRCFLAGAQAVVCQTVLGKIGIMTCYDLRFPELCRCLMDGGAEIVLVSAQWPGVRIEHWDTLLRARAIENQLFVVAANRCGKEGKTHFPGHSKMISPWGTELAAADESAGVVWAEVDSAELTVAREAIPCLRQRMPGAYHV